MPIRIMGTGSFLPEKNVSNTDLEKYVDTSDEWISSRTGIKNRRIAVHETTAGMAAEAAKKALEMAGKEAIDVELIVLATVTPDYYTPSAACQVQAELGADNAIAFDVNAACSGFVFALNALLQKEKLSMQVKKVLVAFLPERVAKYIVRVGRLSNNAFSSFLSGQCLEAVILGCLIFASMKLLGLPYAVLIAVFIGVMSLIPIIGGFIGCWVGVLLIFMVDWKQAIIFIIMFVVVQQFEGNVIYPHVVGNSVGLPAIWVLVAVTIGGNIAGIVGMIFSIPFCSVLYQLFSEIVNKQIKKKNVDIP